MSKKSKLLLAMTLGVSMIASACGSAETPATTSGPSTSPSDKPAESSKPELPPVELTWYFSSALQNVKDLQAVEDEMNKIVKEKINATIRLKATDSGAFEQKINTMNAAGEAYDLVFTAPWLNNYFQNVAKGALLPLDDLLTQYAPKLKSSVPAKVWDATRVNGKIYGSINYQIVAMPYGISIDKRAVDKYGIDINALTKYEDMEPYLAKWNEAFPALLATKGTGEGFTNQPPYWGMDSIGDDPSVGWVRLNDSNLQVINQYATPEFKQFYESKSRWQQAGYFSKDMLDSAQQTARRTNNPEAFTLFSMGTPLKPGVEAEAKQRYGIDTVTKTFSKPLITTNRAIATMTGISATSKNPERAMMFLELINTDKALYNLICNGIEGKHYNVVDKEKGVIEQIKDSGYKPNTDWMFGNQFNGYYINASQIGVWEQTREMNEKADASPLLGFSFNPEPVKTELAATTSVWKQYQDVFANGFDDPAKVLAEFLDKMNKAGAEKIIAEKQKQIDEWKKTAKK